LSHCQDAGCERFRGKIDPRGSLRLRGGKEGMGAKRRRQTPTGPEWGLEVGLHIFCSLVADELKKRLYT